MPKEQRSGFENWRRSSTVEHRRRGCGEREQRRVREAGDAGLGREKDLCRAAMVWAEKNKEEISTAFGGCESFGEFCSI